MLVCNQKDGENRALPVLAYAPGDSYRSFVQPLRHISHSAWYHGDVPHRDGSDLAEEMGVGPQPLKEGMCMVRRTIAEDLTAETVP